MAVTGCHGAWRVPVVATAAAWLLLCGRVASAAQDRIVIEEVRDRQVITYLPPSYDTESERRYPVIYLLHGGGGNPRSFLEGNYQGLNLKTTMGSLIALHVIRELIVVMPDIQTAYREFILNDVIPHIDASYRTLAQRQSRGIAGHSRGGFGALTLATDHPGLFGAVYALSASSLDRDDPIMEGAPERGMRPSLIARVAALRDSIKELAIRFDVGTADRLLTPNQDLAAAMDAAGVPHVFETYPGDHNGVIRQRLATQLLPFFSQKLAVQ